MSVTSRILSIIPAKYRLILSYNAHRIKGLLEPEMELLPELAGNRRRAIDIGANRGLYTYALSRLFCQVEAFEPVPEYYNALIRCGFENVKVHNIGLSDKKGTLAIHIPRGGYGESPSFVDFGVEATKQTVAIKSLDEFGFDEVAFIKIDVEGYESAVLDGARQTIINNRPVMLIEIEQRHLSKPIADVFEQMFVHGYDGFYYKNSRLTPIAEFSYEKDQGPYLGNLRDPNYINNFIFTPKKASK